MKSKEIFEMYKNLDLNERIKFDMEYIKFNEEEKLKQSYKRLEFVANSNNIINEEGQPYFSYESQTMKKFCFIHKWTKWKYIETLNDKLGKPDKLIRMCLKCNKVENYIGFTNVDIITGEKTPYISSF